MKAVLTFIIGSLCLLGYSQQTIVEWSPDYEIGLSDFQSVGTEISPKQMRVSVHSGINIDFAFHMSNVQFLFTKNFNDKVSCNFHKDAAVLIAPDSTQAFQLVRLVQFDFDLSELYARKIRKELYENKKAFSDISFFQPIFDQLTSERNAISSRVYKDTDFGSKVAVLQEEHRAVKEEIGELADFCKECKPKKRKKRKQASERP